MAQDYCYKLNCDDYVLHDGDDPIGPLLPEVAIGYVLDEDGPRMHKHGSPELVRAWMESTREVYKRAGLDQMAGEVHVVQGKLDLEDLNAVIAGATGGLRRILAAQNTIDIEATAVSDPSNTLEHTFTEITPITNARPARRSP